MGFLLTRQIQQYQISVSSRTIRVILKHCIFKQSILEYSNFYNKRKSKYVESFYLQLKGFLKLILRGAIMSLTYSKKLALYLDGDYSTPTPNSSTKHWTIRNWIDFIDQDGCWHLKK